MQQQPLYSPVRQRRESRLVIRGLEYRIVEWGDPTLTPVFYLHGWGDTGTTFQFVMDQLEDGKRVVAPDWRGFGESGHSGSAYWFPDYLADLDELLERYSPNDAVVLIGHSMGANIAALYAGTRPERVQGFVNLEGFGLADSQPEEAPARYRRWLSQVGAAAPFSTYGDFDQLVERIIKRSPRMREERAQFVAREWARREADRRVCLKADPAHKLPNPVLYRRAEAAACWRAITAKVLLVSGADSIFREALADWFAVDPAERPVPGADLEVLTGAGHMLHFEVPDKLAQVIDTFLKTL